MYRDAGVEARLGQIVFCNTCPEVPGDTTKIENKKSGVREYLG